MAVSRAEPRRLTAVKAGLTFFVVMMLIDFLEAAGTFEGIPVLGWGSRQTISWVWLMRLLIKNAIMAVIFGWIMSKWVAAQKAAPAGRTP